MAWTEGQYDACVSLYALRGGREGYDRLKVLARARWPTTYALLQSAGIRPGMRCLDLGCGGGDVTVELACIVGAGGEVVGIDMDEVNLELARATARNRDLANIEFRAQDVRAWSEPDSYDLVYSRFLLEHLSRPIDVLRTMWAAVKSGGALVVEDTDFGGLFCEPPNAAYEFQSRMYPLTIARFGGDSSLGRKLYRLFLEAQIPGPQVKLVQWAETSGEAKRIALLTLEATADSIVEGGFATMAEVESAITDLRTFTYDSTTIVGSPRVFQVWAIRE